MFPSSTHGSIAERRLSADEIMALEDLYPAGRAPVVDGPGPAPSGGCAVAPPAPPAAGSLALLAGGLIVSAARRRTRP
jgi:hypothetical protein